LQLGVLKAPTYAGYDPVSGGVTTGGGTGYTPSGFIQNMQDFYTNVAQQNYGTSPFMQANYVPSPTAQLPLMPLPTPTPMPPLTPVADPTPLPTSPPPGDGGTIPDKINDTKGGGGGGSSTPIGTGPNDVPIPGTVGNPDFDPMIVAGGSTPVTTMALGEEPLPVSGNLFGNLLAATGPRFV